MSNMKDSVINMRGLARKTLNPFNIRYSKKNKWLGSTTPYLGFCCFENIRYGLRAGILLLRKYVLRYHLTTVDAIIKRYAPSSENDTDAYIKFVEDYVFLNCGHLVVSVDDESFFWLCAAICKFECGYVLTHQEFDTIVSSFNIKLYE